MAEREGFTPQGGINFESLLVFSLTKWRYLLVEILTFFEQNPDWCTLCVRGGSELNFTLVERGNSIGAFPLASAPLRRNKTEIFSIHFFNFFLPPFFSFNRNWKIFCFGFLLIRGKRKRSNSNRKRAKIPSPQPPSFLPFCSAVRPRKNWVVWKAGDD